MVTIANIADILAEKDNIVILCHSIPDGDTIGSAYALYDALKNIGKTVRIECADKFDQRFSHITDGIEFTEFVPQFVVAVDVADAKLLGKKQDEYKTVDLCIDHHGTNKPFAKITYVESTASSACEIIFDLCCKLCGDVNEFQAAALYTGIVTDTGCFSYSNTTAHTHSVVAYLMNKGIDCWQLNQKLFAKNKARLLLVATVLSEARFLYKDKVAVQYVDDKIKNRVGACDDDMGCLASLLQEVEGVMLGITIREMKKDTFKLSVRSKDPVSASEFCKKFGGGGHFNASGCTIEGSFDEVYPKIIAEAKETCIEAGIIE